MIALFTRVSGEPGPGHCRGRGSRTESAQDEGRSINVSTMFRACCVAQAPVGFAVTPAEDVPPVAKFHDGRDIFQPD